MVLANVTVVDGTGAPAVPGRTIEITDGRITAIRATVPGESGTVDVAGSFVLPGLIDSHVHLPDDPEVIRAALDSMLSMGITAGREMACCAPDYVEALSRADSTELTRLYWSAFWAGPPFMTTDLRLRDRHAEAGQVPWLRTVTDTTDLEATVRGARDSGATAIKIYSNMDPSLLRDVVQAARTVGLQLWSQCFGGGGWCDPRLPAARDAFVIPLPGRDAALRVPSAPGDEQAARYPADGCGAALEAAHAVSSR